MKLRCTLGHHAAQISDGPFGDVHFTILREAIATEHVVTSFQREALGARLVGEAHLAGVH